ncbi:Mitochondrial import inner membrane translocase subunit TIM44 [Hondaea fermentalgiana]|uniref:Mitochondrial import inner membrane translocase subunit TIM44 n=1 Tax=Hondaea fermentalgiana TaxID=2315210 RepID=A0A2R5GU33_9STRA|nr:Mitochondrial import inner membrane translocase subunit TIM44 [Hondaea fermentalgiana]|eukprot:GBG34360.1 Mitochondrial import inner membrane translocase subunit TIM44 [Hondaea fermentalgiana]
MRRAAGAGARGLAQWGGARRAWGAQQQQQTPWARGFSAASGGSGGDDKKKSDADKGFFARIREEVENDPNVKKSLEELKQSKVGDKTVEETAESFGKTADKASEEAKQRIKEGGEKVSEGAEKAKEAGETVGDFFRDLGKEFGIGGSGKKKADAGASAADAGADKAAGAGADAGAGASADAGSQQQSSSSGGLLSGISSRLSAGRQAVLSKLPESFGSDDRSWDEAFKAVFGVKSRKPRAKATDAEPEWFEAVDKDSGDTYYYNNEGQTVWEKPEGAKIVKAPEHEAHDAAEAHKAKAAEPSFLEKQIMEKSALISQLEEARDAAMAESDTAKFKEINGEIRAMRKEIEKLSAQANTTAMVFVEEEKGTWEKFNETLREAPIFRSILGIADSKVARKARDAAEDVRETLETSQNPMVYRMYSAYDSVFGETEMGEAIREFRKLDPEFSIENFTDEMQYTIVPAVISAFLRGDIPTIESYCSEGAGAAFKAAIQERVRNGRKMDEHILSIGDMNIAAAKVVDKMGPMIFVQFMVQQIDCLYNLKGEVVEGSDDRIVGVFYVMGLTLEYDEELAEVKWVIKEVGLMGQTNWI